MAVQESRLVISIDARNAAATAKNLDKELQNITNSGNLADKQVGVLSGSLKTLAGYMAGVVTVGTAINKMDAYANLQNRLRLVTKNQEELNKATSDTFAIAQKTYQSWDSVVQVYQRFSDNAKTLGINMQKTAELTETVSKAVAISGASTQAAEAALTQFGQALASGVLRGEELNSVMEQTPALAKAIAQGMGITVGQLRTVAAEGKITSDVLVKALGNAASDVDDKFSKMQMTIGQSLTLLDNELTNFASNASGASNVISSSIKLISENLELISSGAMIAGIGYVTAAIATKTTAITADVTAMIAQRAATSAQTAQEVGLAVAATNDAKAHLALIQATNASAQAKYGATAASIRYKQATDAVTEAVVRQAAAEKAAQVATATGARVGASLLGVLGGPVGIGITVASLAAGYLLMRNNTVAATEKLEIQASVANNTREELLKLQGVQREGAKSDLAEAFAAQNKELKESNFLFNSRVIAIQNANKGNTEIVDISNKVRQGLMSQTDALKELNKISYVTPEQLKQLQKAADQYEENRVKAQKTAAAQAVYGEKSKLAGNEAQNAVGKVNDNTNALYDNANAAGTAANAQSKFISNLQKTAIQTVTTNKLIAKGWEIEKAKLTAQALSENNGQITAADIKIIDAHIAANKKLQATEQAIIDSQRAKTKSLSTAAAQAKKDAKEADQLAKEQYDSREEIQYRYAERSRQIEIDLANEIKKIQEANFSPKDTSGYIKNAKRRADLENQLYTEQLKEQLDSWDDTEEQKLDRKTYINELMIQLDSNMNDEMRKMAMTSLKEQANFELDQINLVKKQRLFSAEESFLSEKDKIIRKYQLEREELAKIRDEQERNALLGASGQNEFNDISKGQQSAAQGFANATGVDYSLELELQNKKNAIIEYREWFSMTEAEFNEANTKAEQEYQAAKMDLALSSTEQIFGSMASMFDKDDDRQKKYYKAMLTMEKAASIARSVMAIQTGIAQASSLPFPANLGAMATVAAQTASIIQNIKAIKTEGFADGGYTGAGGKYDVAGLVHRGEVVFSQSDVARNGGVQAVEAMRKGDSNTGVVVQPNIIINIPDGYTAQQNVSNDGTITIDVIDGWNQTLLANPNSKTRRGMAQNTTASARR